MAQAILLKDVEHLGSSGDVIDVASGYLRNFLVPRKLAQQATPGAIADARRRQQAAQREAQQRLEQAREQASVLTRTVLTLTHPAGENGRLFGSVTGREIAEAIRNARGIRIDRRKVRLDQPIRTTGTHMVTVEVAEGVTADIKTIVTAQ